MNTRIYSERLVTVSTVGFARVYYVPIGLGPFLQNVLVTYSRLAYGQLAVALQSAVPLAGRVEVYTGMWLGT